MTCDELQDTLLYVPELGKFVAKKQFGRIRKGDIVGSKDTEGYLTINIEGTKYYIHRLVWLYHYGEWPDVIDHDDHDRSNNKLDNLKNGTHSDNSQNLSLRSTNKTGIQNISINNRDGSFAIQKTVNGKRLFATAKTLEEAKAVKHRMTNGEYDCEERT